MQGAHKRIVCLANSRKSAGRCIAGKEFPAPGTWLRPVSTRPTAELSNEERAYSNGAFPSLLDVIDIPLLAPKLHTFQPENIEIDSARQWEKAGTLPFRSLAPFLDPPAPLWLTGYSSGYGSNDRVPLEQAPACSGSLRLIQPEQLVVRVKTEGKEIDEPKRRVRAAFRHCGDFYHLVVTDPDTEAILFAKPDAEYRFQGAFLTISLGEPFANWCYKLAAALLLPLRYNHP